MDVLLVAKIFYVVCVVMNVHFKVTHCKKIHVSNKAKEDTKPCGKSEDSPCRTIKIASEIAEENDEITIISTELRYQDCSIFVRKPLSFKGAHGRPVIDCGGKDAFIFKYTEKVKKKQKNHSVIKIDVSNLKIQNSKAGFSFSFATSATSLQLENVTFTNNEVDVTWKKASLCHLTMKNVLALGRSGYGIEIEGCKKTTVSLENTRFSGKYLKVISTFESSTLTIKMKGTSFDMSNRNQRILPSDSSEKAKDQFYSPVQVVTALKQTILNIKDSEFLNHFGHRNGMINVTAFQKSVKGYFSQININFYSVSFTNNTSIQGIGGAISFNLSNKLTKKKRHVILFKDCSFLGNSASNGGAVWFSNWVKKSVQFIECTFKDNKAHGNNTGSGGALFALSGRFSITKCKFEGNSAIKSGGTLYLSNMKITSIRIADSDFQNLQRSWSRVEGDIMYFNDVQATFRGRIIFNLSSANSGEPMFLFEGRPAKLVMSNSSVFICPKGYNYDQSKYTLETGRDKRTHLPAYHLFAFSCKPCQDLFYSTTRGSYVANGTETRGACHACPYGASCNGTIRARANFWGILNGDKVEMIPCPKGYCCEREPCENFDTCRAHRTGTLCGYCSDGFTEGMSSTQCFPNEKCKGALMWIWPLFSVVGIFIFLCFRQEIVKKLVNWSLWNDDEDEDDVVEYRGNEGNYNLRESEQHESNSLLSGNREQPINTEFSLELRRDQPDYTHIDESSEYNSGSGFSKVLYYFYQAVLLIRLSSYVSSSSLPNVVIDFLTPFLNFQFTNIWTCAGDSLRPVRKVFLKNSVAYFILGFSLITYGVYRLARHCKGISTDDQPGFQARSYPVRLVGTVMHVILLSYVAQTQCVVQLLNCVKVGDEDVLYIDGSVVCFRSYQIAMWVFFVLYILFLPVSLLVGLRLLISRWISWKEFMISCFLPFFCLIYWIYKYLRHRNGTKSWVQLPESNNPFEAKIIYIIRHPYKSRKFPNAKIVERCSENWEASLILRRLVLVLVYIFVESFLLRAYLFFIVSVLFLLAHVFVQPYKNDKVNKLDNISLAVIVLISGLSIAEATYNNAGQLVPHSVEMLQYFQDWFLALLPFFLLIIFFFPRVKHYILRCMKKSQSNPVATDEVSEILSNPCRRNGMANETSPLTT